MKGQDEPRWTIDELGVKATAALAVDYAGPPNDRVRDVPDRRTIRYYTTLGLIDRPAEMRGRTAYYGPRHLMQLAAIKRLQADGQSLAEVQQRLLGLTNSALAALARLPEGLERRAPPQGATAPRAQAFWKALPAEPAPEPELPRPPAPALQGIRLGDDATLLLASNRPVELDDIDAIRKAAAPLLKILTRRGLIAPNPGKEGDPNDDDDAAATADRRPRPRPR